MLLERGHTIRGVITGDADVTRWANEKQIPRYTPGDDLLAILRQQPFDYLFSIINNVILSGDVLATPQSYAGTYATT